MNTLLSNHLPTASPPPTLLPSSLALLTSNNAVAALGATSPNPSTLHIAPNLPPLCLTHTSPSAAPLYTSHTVFALTCSTPNLATTSASASPPPPSTNPPPPLHHPTTLARTSASTAANSANPPTTPIRAQTSPTVTRASYAIHIATRHPSTAVAIRAPSTGSAYSGCPTAPTATAPAGVRASGSGAGAGVARESSASPAGRLSAEAQAWCGMKAVVSRGWGPRAGGTE
ncbi:hypothetical protein GTA08_BOTSDO08973 [Neofusicoccum parvum]|nr:hypothetical protein GTA08_BOTSDO08973 [Neofusicoccum parvum]